MEARGLRDGLDVEHFNSAARRRSRRIDRQRSTDCAPERACLCRPFPSSPAVAYSGEIFALFIIFPVSSISFLITCR